MELEGTLVALQGLWHALQFPQSIAAVHIRHRVIWLLRQGGIKCSETFCPALHIAIGQPQAVPRLGIVRLALQSLLVRRNCCIPLAHITQSIAPVGPSLGKVRFELQGFVIGRQCLRMPMKSPKNQPEVGVH